MTSESAIAADDELMNLVADVLELPLVSLLPAERPWDLSAVDKLKVALLLESLTGEHYDTKLLEFGIQSLADCVAMYHAKRSHSDARPAADPAGWREVVAARGAARRRIDNAEC